MVIINEAGAGIEKIDFAALVLDDAAKKEITWSMLYLGVALKLDDEATTESKDLLAKSETALKNLSGFAAMKQAPPIKRSAENCKWTGEVAPPQVKQLTSAMTKVSDYAKSKGIAIPNKEEIAAKALEFQ
jgi:hypothetical protein